MLFIRSLVTLFLLFQTHAVVEARYKCHSQFPPKPIKYLHPILPANATAYHVVDPTTPLRYVAVGRGVQNYTCTNNTFVSVGAVAWLYDVSCVSEHHIKKIPKEFAEDQVCTDRYPVLAKHIFTLSTFAPTPLPKFDASRALKNNDAFILAKKAGSVPDPINPVHNVAWLQLTGVEGQLGTVVYRTNTYGGQPPSGACYAGTKISIPYAALYWVY